MRSHIVCFKDTVSAVPTFICGLLNHLRTAKMNHIYVQAMVKINPQKMHQTHAWMCVHVHWINDEKRVETKETKQSVQNDKYKRSEEKHSGFLCRTPMAQKAFMIFSHVLMSYSEKNKKKITNKILVPLITVNDNDFACQTIPRAHQMTASDPTVGEKRKKHISYICNIFENVQHIDFWCFIYVRVEMEWRRFVHFLSLSRSRSRTLAVCKRRHDSCNEMRVCCMTQQKKKNWRTIRWCFLIGFQLH